MSMTRKNFIKLLAPAIFIPRVGLFASPLPSLTSTKNKISFGWTTCLTYQTGDRKLGFDYYANLLDEMKQHGLDRLIVMMASHGYFSPGNHGLAWPVKKKQLFPQVDDNALNAHEETEFFSKVIDKAKSMGIKILIEIKYLGMVGMHEGYPGIDVLRTKEGNIIHTIDPNAGEFERKAIEALHICSDNPQTHAYMRDKIEDVLTRYKTLDGIVLEHPSYSGNTCYCSHSRAKIKSDIGRDIEQLTQNELLEWKAQRIKDTLIDLKNLIKSINPNFEFGFYTGFSPSDGNIKGFQLDRGHDTKTLNQVGLDFVLPYCEGRHEQKETREIERVIDYLAPLDFYLHTTIRRDMPTHYKLPPKGPEYVKNIIAWAKQAQKENPRFKGMTFFNEVKIPQENRQAVYDSI